MNDITFAQYCNSTNPDGSIEKENVCIKATIAEKSVFVPLDPANRHYSEIMRQVEAGELTIQEAEA